MLVCIGLEGCCAAACRARRGTERSGTLLVLCRPSLGLGWQRGSMPPQGRFGNTKEHVAKFVDGHMAQAGTGGFEQPRAPNPDDFSNDVLFRSNLLPGVSLGSLVDAGDRSRIGITQANGSMLSPHRTSIQGCSRYLSNLLLVSVLRKTCSKSASRHARRRAKSVRANPAIVRPHAHSSSSAIDHGRDLNQNPTEIVSGTSTPTCVGLWLIASITSCC